MADIVRIVRVTGRADGMDAVAAALLRVRDAENQVTQAGEVLSRTDPLRAYSNWQSRMDPSIRAMRAFRGEIDLVSRQFERVRAQPGAFDQFGRDVDAAKRKLQELGTELSRRQGIDQSAVNRLLGVRAQSSGQARESASAFEVAFQRRDKDEADRVTAALREQRAEYDRLGRTRNELLQRADPLGAAQERHNLALADAKRLVDQRRISEGQYLAILEHEADVLRRVNLDFGQGKGGFRQHQANNLRYQGFDVVQSLALGMPLPMVAMQQGPQIAQVLGDAPGGVMGGVKTLAASAVAAITPFNVVLGASAASATAAAVALYKFNSSVDAVEASLRGAGRASGVSARDVDAAARQAGSFNGGFGQSDARSIFAAMASSGYADRGLFTAGSAVTAARYGRTTGQDASGVGADFAQIFGKDAAQGIELVQQKIGGVTAAQRLYIETLARSGERGRAHAEIMRLIAQNTVGATDGMNGFQRALQGIGGAWDFFVNNVGRGFDRVFDTGPIEQQLAKAEQYLRSARARQSFLGFDLGGDAATSEAQVADLRRRLAEAEKRRTDAQEARRGDEVSTLTRSLLPELDRHLQLETQIANLRSSGGAGKSVTASQEADALARATAARKTLLTDAERAQKTEELALRAVTDRTLAERQVTAEKQKELDLSGQLVGVEERLRQATAARALEAARAKRETEDLLRDSRDLLRGSGALPYQRGLIDLQNTFRRERERLGDSPDLQRSQANRRQAFNNDQLGGPLQQASLNIKEMAGALDVQQRSFYATAEQAAVYGERQRLINEYTRQGVTDLSALMPQIDAQARAYGRMVGEMDKVTKAQRNIVEGMDELRSGTRGLMSGALGDILRGKDPTQSLVNGLTSMTERYIERTVFKPLVEQMLGPDGKPGGGWWGDAASKMFAPTTTGTMQVSAATVIIGGAGAGGLSGLIPGLGGQGSAGGATGAAGIGGGATVQAPFSAAGTIVSSGGRVLSFTRGGSGAPISSDPGVLLPYKTPGEPDLPSSTSVGVDPLSMLPKAALPMREWWQNARNGVRLFNPNQSAVERDFYPDLNRELTIRAKEMADATTQAGSQLSTAISDTASGVNQAGPDLVNSLLSIATKGGGGGGGLLGSLLGGGSGGGSFSTGAEVWYADGGFTGAGGRYEPAGVVHRGEYVFSAPSVSRIGLQRLEAMHRGYADGGLVTPLAPQPVPMPPMLAAVPAPASPGDASGGGGQPINFTIDVRGATGNSEVQEMVRAGMAQAIAESQRQTRQNIGPMMAEWQKRKG